MLEGLKQVSRRLAYGAFLGTAFLVCIVASACSGSTSSTSSSSEDTTTAGTGTTTAGTTTAEDPNLPAFARTLQPQIEEQVNDLRVPGAVVYVDVPGEGTWSTSFGTDDLATGTPMKPEDHFRVASNTKTFTGTVILQLVDEGKLGLDDPVSKYRPEVPNGENITIRQLLNMTSGLYNYAEDKDFNETLDTEPDKVWTPEEVDEIGLQNGPYFAPGEGFHYSNTNTVLLGLIVEQLTGRPLEQEFQERLFEPLGMINTLLPERSSAVIPDPYSHGYMYQTNVESLNTSVLEGEEAEQADQSASTPNDVTGDNPSWGWAAGAGISTLQDLRVWVKALATGEFLSPETQRERLTYVSPPPSPGANYGLAIADFAGFIGHDGQLPGYNTFMGFNPETGATIIVLTNLYTAPDGNAPATEIAKLIIKELSSTGGEVTMETTSGERTSGEGTSSESTSGERTTSG
jgi:D-alanyl-D-alanine carboxypeptidase